MFQAVVINVILYILIQNSYSIMYKLGVSVTPLFYSLLHLQHALPPIPSFPLSSLLFSFPLISHSPLLYLRVTLISLSTGLWDVCVCECVCKRKRACVCV